MGLLYIEILREIFEEFPDLEPPSEKQTSTSALSSLPLAVHLVGGAMDVLVRLRLLLEREVVGDARLRIDAINAAEALIQALITELRSEPQHE